MSLTSGTNLGPYEIVAPLGAGGMGEVYRARDTRLNRTVALKILPEAFSSDPTRLHRFEYEARILSTLNHPNVLAIYDVGAQDGVRYLVSEFLEGQTLREKLAAGGLSRWRIVEYALETARGLAAAHEKGVVHRDLKPDNIFITHDDRVKILDFGLAKQAESADDDAATVTQRHTTPGTVMGTVGYMSPEQVRGQVVDHRSDIFSFGAVLYEMVSGKRAFQGESSVETMNAILKEDVAETGAGGMQVSPGLERIIRRCLEKKPERRFQSASDLAFALEALSGTSSSAAPVVSAPIADKKKTWPWVLGGAIVIALAAASLWIVLRSPSSSARFTQITFRSAYIRTARFAAGKVIVYGAAINGAPMQVQSIRTDTLQSQPTNFKADLLAISGSGEMALSLDRNFGVGWVPTGRLAKAALGGGATRELLDNVTDADWNPDGSELAITRRVGGEFRLEYPPGNVLYRNLGYISDVRFSPAGDRIAFMDHPIYGDDRGDVAVVDLKGNRTALARNFVSEQGLDWSANGKEIWFTGSQGAEINLLRAVDLHGRVRVVAAAPARMHLQDIASDGRVVLSSELLRWQIGMVDTKSGQARDLTNFQWPEIESISRDGSMILLNSFDILSDTSYRLYAQRTDGSEPVFIGKGAGTSFSADGKWVTAVDPAHLDHASIIPTGVGETTNLQAPSGWNYSALGLLPDGKRLLVSLVATGQPPHAGLQDLETGAVTDLGPPGRHIAEFAGMMLPGASPDGKYCILTDDKGKLWRQPLDGGDAREIHGVNPDDRLLEWHADSNNVFFSRVSRPDVEIYTLNLTTGERKLWTRFSPADKTALAGDTWVMITPDGAHYSYMVERIYSTLYLADGLR